MTSTDRLDASARPEHRSEARRITEIQGLRAVAIILVVINHAGLPLHGGFVGVDVFFVISGYVITRLLWKEFEARGRIRLGSFYAARVRRLLPASALAVVFCAVAAIVVQSPLMHRTVGINVIGSSLWSGNGTLFLTSGGYFDSSRHLAPLLHMWSLAVEEQFYLVFPLVLMLAAVATRGRSSVRRRRMLGLLGLLGVLSLLLSIWMTYAGDPVVNAFAYYSPLTRAWEFVLGAVVCLVAARPSPRMQQVLATLGSAMILWGAVRLHPDDHIPGYLIAIPTVGAALILASLNNAGTAPTLVGRVLNAPAMQRIGDLSYGWYLWHWPLVVFASIGREPDALRSTVMSIAALGVAALSHRWVEEPFRRAPRIPVRRYLAVCLMPPVALGLLMIMVPRFQWGNDNLAVSMNQLSALPPNFWSCVSREPFTTRDMEPCTFNADAAGKPVVVLGDSTAVHLTDGVLEAAISAGRPLIVGAASSCAFVDLTVESIEEYCSGSYDSALEWLRSLPPSTVLLHHAVIPRGLVNVSHASHAAPDEWSASLGRAFEEVRAAGHEPVHVSSPPFFVNHDEPWDPRACTFAGFIGRSADCAPSESRSVVDRRQEPILGATRRAVQKSGVDSIDVRAVLCPDQTCSTHAGGQWRFIDSTHMTVASSRALAPVFEEVLRSTNR